MAIMLSRKPPPMPDIQCGDIFNGGREAFTRVAFRQSTVTQGDYMEHATAAI